MKSMCAAPSPSPFSSLPPSIPSHRGEHTRRRAAAAAAAAAAARVANTKEARRSEDRDIRRQEKKKRRVNEEEKKEEETHAQIDRGRETAHPCSYAGAAALPDKEGRQGQERERDREERQQLHPPGLHTNTQDILLLE